jgi:DNA-binding response OmpR family regulator
MKTVLVVDDDADVRELIVWKLTHAGYATVAAPDGRAGFIAAGGGADGSGRVPDLILVDWMMPRMTGIELCQALRDDPATAGVPIILLTAKADEAEVERGFAIGVDDYIVKPFSPREMLSRVQAVLARAGART